MALLSGSREHSAMSITFYWQRKKIRFCRHQYRVWTIRGSKVRKIPNFQLFTASQTTSEFRVCSSKIFALTFSVFILGIMINHLSVGNDVFNIKIKMTLVCCLNLIAAAEPEKILYSCDAVFHQYFTIHISLIIKMAVGLSHSPVPMRDLSLCSTDYQIYIWDSKLQDWYLKQEEIFYKFMAITTTK